MSEHVIRLRKAWDGPIAHASEAVTSRIDLPTVWNPVPTEPFRLQRQFQRPPIAEEREQLVLRLEQVVGLTEVRLNGERLALEETMPSVAEIVLNSAAIGRNRLFLYVNPALWVNRWDASLPWGDVSLVIRDLGVPRGRTAGT
jgi:hypothetical protein